MATITVTTPESHFMGDPMTCTVHSMQVSDPSISFHRVKLQVSVSWTEPNGTERTYSPEPLSRPVSNPNGEDLVFDYSSVVRAAADLYDMQPVAPAASDTSVDHGQYPGFKVSFYAYDSWVQYGVPNNPDVGNNKTSTYSTTAIMGRTSDFERLTRKDSDPIRFTRRPTSPEVKARGEIIVAPWFKEAQDTIPHCYSYRLSATHDLGAAQILGQRYYIIDRHPRGSVQFQFINSRGVRETVTAHARSSEKSQSAKTDSVISRFETFTNFSRTLTRKQLKPTEYTLCSGFVHYDWAEWWAYEFCQASRHWMLITVGGEERWIPCIVSINDSTTVIDRTKTALCYVEFTVRPDINGPLW